MTCPFSKSTLKLPVNVASSSEQVRSALDLNADREQAAETAVQHCPFLSRVSGVPSGSVSQKAVPATNYQEVFSTKLDTLKQEGR